MDNEKENKKEDLKNNQEEAPAETPVEEVPAEATNEEVPSERLNNLLTSPLTTLAAFEISSPVGMPPLF